jgi:catechol 2,3-dioxygenase-like lactoylglutathione lyase family enzyme
MPRLCPILACAVLASTLGDRATAEDVLGEVALRIGAEDLVWLVRSPGADTEIPETGYRDFGFVWQVRLSALGDGADGVAGVLHVVFSGPSGAVAPNERLIVFEDETSGKRYVSADDDDGAVIVEQLDLGERTGFAAGRLQSRLCARDGLFFAADPEDCLSIEGSFRARLPVDG